MLVKMETGASSGGESGGSISSMTMMTQGATGSTAVSYLSGIPKVSITNTITVTKNSGNVTAIRIYSGKPSGTGAVYTLCNVNATTDISSIINDSTYDYVTLYMSVGAGGTSSVTIDFV